MNFLPLCASALRLLPQRARKKISDVDISEASKDSTHDASKDSTHASRESTDVLEECAPSGTGSDNQYDQSIVSSDRSRDPDDSAPEVEVDPTPDRCAVLKAAAPWRRKCAAEPVERLVHSEHIEKELDSRDVEAEASSYCHSCAKGSEVAAVLRWDNDLSSWVPEDIEITEAPPLPRFARLIAYSNGVEACPHKDGYSCEIYFGHDVPRAKSRHGSCGEADLSSSAWDWFCNPEATTRPSPHLRPEAEPFTISGKSVFNKSAREFVPGQAGNEVACSSPASTFNPSAPVFVPEAEVTPLTLDGGGVAENSTFNVSAPVFVPGQGGQADKSTTSCDDTASHVRPRLSSSAAAFVPCWEAVS